MMKPIHQYLTIKFDMPMRKTKSGLIFLGKPIKSTLGTITSISDEIEDLKVGGKVMVNRASETYNNQALVRKDEEPIPYLCRYEDLLGGIKTDGSFYPLGHNVVVKQPDAKGKTDSGILIPKHDHRSRRQSAGSIEAVGKDCEYVETGEYVALGQYAGIYFEDTDGIEKIVVSENEILGTLTEKADIDVKHSQQHLDTESFDQSLHRATQ